MRLIDADDYIKSINERIKEAYKWYDKCNTDEIKIRAEQAIATFCEASLTAKKMPTVEAEPVRHGRWEFIGGYGYQYRCSKCIMCADHRTNYCPNCGAKMDLDEVENGTDSKNTR